MKKIKFLALTMSALLSANFAWGEEVTDIINIVGYNNSTTSSNSYISGQDDADTSEGGIAVAACNYAGNGATRGNKTSIGTGSDCNFHIYNTEAYPGAITKIEISAIGVGTTSKGVTTYGRYQNNLYASMGTSSRGSVSTVEGAIAGNLTQGSSTEEDVSKFTWTFDASNNYTYFKLLTNEKFVSGTMKGAQITVTYVTGSSCEEPTVLTDDGACQTNTDYDLAENCFLSDNTSAVTFTCTSSNKSSCTISGSTFRATAAGTYTIKATQAEDGTYCAVEETFNVVVTAPTCYVTFLNNSQPVTSIGTDGVKTYHEGDQLGELPTLTSDAACDEHSNHFMGWYAGEPIRTKQTEAPTFVNGSTPVNDNMTLRAVWAKAQ